MNPAYQQFLTNLADFVKALRAYLISMPDLPPTPPAIVQNSPAVAPSNPPTPTPVPPTLESIMAEHPYGWCAGPIEERKAMYALAQRVAKEEGLGISLTADMLATIWGESGFNAYCVNTKTKDYGIAQFSEKYYLVEYKMTPVDALLNPEQCLRIMARNFLAGRQKNWVAYQPNNPQWVANRTRPVV